MFTFIAVSGIIPRRRWLFMKYYTIREFSQLVGKTAQTFFACRLQGKRANQAKTFAKDFKEHD